MVPGAAVAFVVFALVVVAGPIPDGLVVVAAPGVDGAGGAGACANATIDEEAMMPMQNTAERQFLAFIAETIFLLLSLPLFECRADVVLRCFAAHRRSVQTWVELVPKLRSDAWERCPGNVQDKKSIWLSPINAQSMRKAEAHEFERVPKKERTWVGDSQHVVRGEYAAGR